MSEREDARTIATRVLLRVERDGAYASLTLDAELGAAHLDPRDAGLATEIVYGALRTLPALDGVIDAQLHKRGDTLDPVARAAMRAAAYQILHLGRVPPHAAVDRAVSIVASERGAKIGGFVNAVLRKIAKLRPASPEIPPRLVLAPWLEKKLAQELGADRLEALLSRTEPPAVCLRVEGDRDAYAARLREARPDADVREARLSPHALHVRGAGDPRALPGFLEGAFSVQEEGSQLIALLAGARPGERVADVCAGHGGKSTYLARAVGPQGHVTAIDLYEEKLARIPAELTRLGIPVDRVDSVAVDLTVGTGGLGPFDRVLVDAPCTGLGTLRRRPEIALRLSRADIRRLAAQQLEILARAAEFLRPGATLVYAVCSPTRDEAVQVADQLEQRFPELRRTPAEIDNLPADPDGITRIGPWHHEADVDAYQLVAWQSAATQGA